MSSLSEDDLKRLAQSIYAEVRHEDATLQSNTDREINASARQRMIAQGRIGMLEDRAESAVGWGLKLFD